jgi:WXG100 family type VII secretion target
MAYFSVDSEQVFAANAHIQSTIGRLQGEISTLHSQLATLEGSWQGAAATSFQELMVRWKSAAEALEQNLGQIGHALGIAAQQYADIEAANQRLFL